MKNGNLHADFEKLEETIKTHEKFTVERKKNKYLKMKQAVLQAAVETKQTKQGVPSAVKGKRMRTQYEAEKSTETVLRKEDCGAVGAFSRLCQLIEWLHGFVSGRTDVQLPVTKTDSSLEEKYVFMYGEAQQHIFDVRDRIQGLTRDQEKRTISTPVRPPVKTKAAATAQESPSQLRKNIHDKAIPNFIQKGREDYAYMEQDFQKKLKEQCLAFEEKIETLKQELHNQRQENERLRTRLSKVAGDKLKHNNPNIADLSDPNRPQKLAERYGELYDNEWTEAMDKLNKTKDEKNDRSCIDTLKSILEFCYSESEKLADNQLSQMEKDSLNLPGHNKQESDIPDTSDAMKRHLLDAQHVASIVTVNAAVEIVTTSLLKNRLLVEKARQIQPYTAQCIEICWMMVTHHPRLVLFSPDVSHERKIQRDMFQLYTRSGDTLEFVVWPAMLLHKAGPLLRKGSVQPIASKK